MELGNLSTSLSEALGISEDSTGGERNGYSFVKLEGDTMSGNLTLENHTGPIGAYSSKNDTSSLSTGSSFTEISGSSMSLTAGRYVVTGSIKFAGNTTGYRGLAFKTSNGVESESSVVVQTNPSASWSTRLASSLILIVENTDTISLAAIQNSGGSLSADWFIKVIRIR